MGRGCTKCYYIFRVAVSRTGRSPGRIAAIIVRYVRNRDWRRQAFISMCPLSVVQLPNSATLRSCCHLPESQYQPPADLECRPEMVRKERRRTQECEAHREEEKHKENEWTKYKKKKEGIQKGKNKM